MYLGTTITYQNFSHEGKSVFHLRMLIIIQFWMSAICYLKT